LCTHISRPPQDSRFLFGALRLGQAAKELQHLTTLGDDKLAESFLLSFPKVFIGNPLLLFAVRRNSHFLNGVAA
jgi:hypothetical protein